MDTFNSSTCSSPRKRDRRSAFTIIELLVVMSIMVLLLAALAPAIFNVDEDGRLTAGVNTVAAATQAARALSSKRSAAVLDIPAATDSGVALVFTASNEMRLAKNNQRANYGAGGTALENLRYHGYNDSAIHDYIILPRGIGVAGIVAPNDPAGPGVIPPPFAIRFSGQDGLIAGMDTRTPTDPLYDPSSLIVYDANGDGNYDIGSRRPASYDPRPYDPEAVGQVTGNYDAALGKYKLPFEVLEPVIGVIVYSKGDFEDANQNWATSATNAAKWLTQVDPKTGLLKNGKILLISRASGAATK